MRFSTLVDRRAAAVPDGPAVADSRSALSNAELLSQVQSVAAQLGGNSIGRGDVVAIMLPNQVEFVVTMFASWRLGAAVTPLNPKYRLFIDAWKRLPLAVTNRVGPLIARDLG